MQIPHKTDTKSISFVSGNAPLTTYSIREYMSANSIAPTTILAIISFRFINQSNSDTYRIRCWLR